MKAPALKERLSSSLAALRIRNVSLIIAGTILVSWGNSFVFVSVGWLAYEVTGSATVVALAIGIRYMPLLFSPFFGVLADRIEGRVLLIATSVYMASLTSAFALFVRYSEVQDWQIYTFMFLTGIGYAVGSPVRRTYLARSCPKELLPTALALYRTGFEGFRIVSPAFIGIMIGLFGVEATLYAQAVVYGGCMFPFFVLKPVPHDTEAVRRSTPLANLVEGLSYIRSERRILGLTVLELLLALFGGVAVFTLLPVFSEEVLGAGAEGYGFLHTAGAIGGFLATLLSVHLANTPGKGRIMFLGTGLAGLLLVAFSQVPWLVASLVLFALLRGMDEVGNIMSITMVQLYVDDKVRGRVTSIFTMFVGLMPIAGLMAGAAANALGIGTAVMLAGLWVCLVTVAVSIGFRVLYEPVESTQQS